MLSRLASKCRDYDSDLPCYNLSFLNNAGGIHYITMHCEFDKAENTCQLELNIKRMKIRDSQNIIVFTVQSVN